MGDPRAARARQNGLRLGAHQADTHLGSEFDDSIKTAPKFVGWRERLPAALRQMLVTDAMRLQTLRENVPVKLWPTRTRDAAHVA